MGVDVADTDSEFFDEKGQTMTAHKQSHCPFVLVKQFFWEHRENREQQYRPRIDEIRGEINKSRKKVEGCRRGPWQGTTSTEQRRLLWEHGLDSVSLKYSNFEFSTNRRYKVTTSNSTTGSKNIVIHDFRTPQGREEAFRWWEEKHLRQERYTTKVLTKYYIWEETFQKYINQHHSRQREILLRGVAKVNWVNTKVEALPN